MSLLRVRDLPAQPLPRHERTLEAHPEPISKSRDVGQRPPHARPRGPQYQVLLDPIRRGFRDRQARVGPRLRCGAVSLTAPGASASPRTKHLEPDIIASKPTALPLARGSKHVQTPEHDGCRVENL